MIVKKLSIDQLVTERLILIPYTKDICKNVLNGDYSDLEILNLSRGKSWPDEDVLDTLPRIINNLSKVAYPTGFESWMIVKKATLEIIGDLGFKGYNIVDETIDLGYGIIQEERRNGYAKEGVSAIIKWAFTNPIVKEITANCLKDNVSSINLLHQLEFKKLRTTYDMIYWNLENPNR